MYEAAVAGENQVLDHERLGNLEEKIKDLNTEIEKLKNANRPPTPEQQEDVPESVSAAIKKLNLDEQAIRIYSAKADISNILWEYFYGILTLMIVIFGTIFGASSLGAFRFLKGRIERRAKQLEEELKKEATEQKNVIVTRILTTVGYTHWKLYEEKKNDADLGFAVASTRRALEYAGRIQDEEEYDKEIAYAKNNLVYYLLEKKGRSKSEESIIWECAEYILKISRKKKHQGEEHWYEWRDTYVWMLLEMGHGSDEEGGKKMFRELMEHGKTPHEWREGTLQRYREKFDWVAQEYPPENK